MATFQWLRCNAAGTACVPIPGATGATYTLTTADQGATVAVQASDGSTAVQASPTSLVTAGSGITRDLLSVSGGPLPVPVTPLTAPGPPLLPAGSSTPIQGGPSTSLTGWNHLTRQWAETLPTALHYSRTLRRAALRQLPSGRKVGR